MIYSFLPSVGGLFAVYKEDYMRKQIIYMHNNEPRGVISGGIKEMNIAGGAVMHNLVFTIKEEEIKYEGSTVRFLNLPSYLRGNDYQHRSFIGDVFWIGNPNYNIDGYSSLEDCNFEEEDRNAIIKCNEVLLNNFNNCNEEVLQYVKDNVENTPDRNNGYHR